MGTLPKPLIGLLLGTVAFFAIWMVALKPSSSSSGGSQGGVGQYQSAIDKAHQAVTTSNQANAKLGAPTSTTPPKTSPTPAKTSSTPARASSTPARASSTPAKGSSTHAKATHLAKTSSTPAKATHSAKAHVKSPANPFANDPVWQQAAPTVTGVKDSLIHGDVLAVLFYNPAGSDDQAMVKQLEALPVGENPVAKFYIPLSWLTQFPMITTQVSVVTSPTLVIINPQHQATTITGFASSDEVGTRIADALAAKSAAK